MFLTGVCPGADSCPVLCSGNGVYEKGRCACLEGWKGAECNVEEGQCIDPTCSNHGTCINGLCLCSPAHKGNNCEQGIVLVVNISDEKSPFTQIQVTAAGWRGQWRVPRWRSSLSTCYSATKTQVLGLLVAACASVVVCIQTFHYTQKKVFMGSFSLCFLGQNSSSETQT